MVCFTRISISSLVGRTVWHVRTPHYTVPVYTTVLLKTNPWTLKHVQDIKNLKIKILI